MPLQRHNTTKLNEETKAKEAEEQKKAKYLINFCNATDMLDTETKEKEAEERKKAKYLINLYNATEMQTGLKLIISLKRGHEIHYLRNNHLFHIVHCGNEM